jgi:hypothetical protein
MLVDRIYIIGMGENLKIDEYSNFSPSLFGKRERKRKRKRELDKDYILGGFFFISRFLIILLLRHVLFW